MTSLVTSVSVEESRWTCGVRIGAVELLVHRSGRRADVRSSAAGPPILSRARPMARGVKALGALTILASATAVLGVGAVGVGAHASEGPHRVVRPIPERTMTAGTAERRPEIPAFERSVRVEGSIPVAATKVNEAHIAEPRSSIDDGDAGTVLVSGSEPVSIGAEVAIERAVSTGRLQQWRARDGLQTGFVVVGEPDPQAGRCRDLSVLTRDGFVSRVAHLRRCPGERTSTADPPTGTSEAPSTFGAAEPAPS